MRYYAVSIIDQQGNPAKVGPFPGKLPQFTSYVNGQTIQGALNIEMDLPLTNWDAPMGGAFIRITGIGIQDITQASNLNGMSIQISGGMQKGLPLANPLQARLLVSGTIQQAFGNWQGTQQSLDLLIQGQYGTPSSPVNIVFNCATGALLANAAVSALKIAFPGVAITTSLSPKLVLPNDAQPSYFQTLGQFATFLGQLSRDILDPNGLNGYQGIKLTVLPTGEIVMVDGTSPATPTPISFTDLIGQPTWIAPGVVQSKLVLRGDIQVGDYIKYPPGQQTILAQSFSQARDKSAFQGVFQVNQVRHLGNFRQKDADSWVSVIDAVVNVVTQ